MNTVGHHSALIYVMVVVSASDGAMSDRELRTIGQLIKTLPVFRDFEEHRLAMVAKDCAALLQEPDGINAVLGLVKAALPHHLRETAYWLALEVALTDSRVMLEEIRVLEGIRRELGLDRLTAAAIERGARARYQVA
ncbi:MAG TPA: tellurite resistance TerB family protein [Rhizomicrobium sp.]|nr:tellurite resistance TerB family protein [Rhizomicrobium sp.]